MHDDPDARLQAAEPPDEGVIEAAEMTRPHGKQPYHDAIAPELLDDLHLAIGKGLALVGADEGAPPAAWLEAIARYLDDARDGKRRSPSDPTETSLALGCLLGQAVCRELGWGWAHVRRTRRPGILVISPDRRYALAPRAMIEHAAQGNASLRELAARLRTGEALPRAKPGEYLRVSVGPTRAR